MSSPLAEYARRAGRRLKREAWIVSTLAILFAVALLLIGSTIYLSALRQDANRLDLETRIVTTNIGNVQDALAENVLDYAVWNEAVRNLVTQFSPAWARRNVGPSISSILHYDISAVVDSAGRTLYAQSKGEEAPGSLEDLFGPRARLLLERSRANPASAASAVLGSVGRPILAAAAAIQWEPGNAEPPPADPPYVLFFGKRLDLAYFEPIGAEYQLKELRLLSPSADPGSLATHTLVGPDDETVARIAWRPSRPGRMQLNWQLPAIAGALLAVVIFAGVALRGLRHAQALGISESRLRDFAEISSDWFWETDDQLRFAWFSSSFAVNTGIDPDGLLGHRRDELFRSHDPTVDWDAHLADLTAHRPFRDFIYSYHDRLGVRHTVRISGQPVFDETGRFICYRGSGRDITAEWIADQRLRESENRFRSLVENLRGILFCRGVAGSGPYGYDQNGLQVFGADAIEIAGTVDQHGRAKIEQWYTAVDPADRPGYLEVERMRKEQGRPYHIDYRITHPITGERRWVREAGWVVQAPDSELRYLDSYILDITEQRAREAVLADTRARLEQQNQELLEARQAAEAATLAKSEFLAAMSHEIRTPMTSVLGMTDLLAAEPLTVAQRRYVETIRTSGRHLLGVINSILDFSRIEAGRLDLEHIDFTINEVLEQVHSLLAPQAAERGLLLGFQSGREVTLAVRGDPTRLRQVLMNLVGNALKFTVRGRVDISAVQLPTDDGQPRIRFAVRDTGIGIASERLNDLFTPFVQADSSTARRFGGSGLGLAICKRLVEAMGGLIGVESRPGTGSTFWFELPFELGSPAALAERSALDRTKVPPLRILVVDDVAVNRDMLAEMLRRQGHDILLAEDGARALEIAGRERLDVVLMDVQMPVMDGMEATRRIRKLPGAAAKVPIMALTANVMPAERSRYIASGMNLCLTKPVVWPDLFAALAGAANGRLPAPSAPPEPPPPPPQPAADVTDTRGNPLLDHTVIEGLTRNTSADIVRTLLSRGLESADESIRRLQTILGDGVELAREAHRLRGTAGSFGLARVSSLAGAIEDGLPDCDAGALVGELGAALQDTRAAAKEAGLLP
jgi:PAS domain S-box-containing protein